jgi:hypothetical protein
MKRHPNLKGRYDGSVLAPLQWGLLAVIGYVALLGFQVDALRRASFRLELFDREVARVEHAAHAARPAAAPAAGHLMLVAPEDWPAPPIQTAWSPKPLVREVVVEKRAGPP